MTEALFLVGMIVLALVGLAVLVVLVLALRTYAELAPEKTDAADLSEVYKPIGVEKALKEGPRGSRYVMQPHEIIAGLALEDDFDSLLALEREREKT